MLQIKGASIRLNIGTWAVLQARRNWQGGGRLAVTN
jgi:hypothetical protein